MSCQFGWQYQTALFPTSMFCPMVILVFIQTWSIQFKLYNFITLFLGILVCFVSVIYSMYSLLKLDVLMIFAKFFWGILFNIDISTSLLRIWNSQDMSTDTLSQISNIIAHKLEHPFNKMLPHLNYLFPIAHTDFLFC